VNLLSGEVAGQNLWAEASTKVMNAQDAVAMLEAKIPELIKSCVTITPLDKEGRPMLVTNAEGKEVPSTAPASVDEDASSGQATLTWFVKMGVDKKYYKEILFPLVKQCLDTISGESAESFTTNPGKFDDGVSLWKSSKKIFPGRQLSDTIKLRGDSQLHVFDAGFFLIKDFSKSLDSFEMLIYRNAKNSLLVNSDGYGTLAKVNIVLTDGEEETLAKHSFTAWQPFSSYENRLIIIGPAVDFNGFIGFKQPIVQKISLKIPIPLLKEVKKVEFSLEQVPFKLGLAKRE
jgi:hypothetical protein